jgi:hypothetical protein
MSRRSVVLLALTGLWLLGLAGPALADSCGSPADCFGQAGSFGATAFGLLGLAGVSLFLDFVPVVGTGKGILEAALGRDLLTGQELSPYERILGVVPLVGGVAAVGGAARAVDRVGDAVDTAADVRRAGDRIFDATDPVYADIREYTGAGYATLNPFLRDPDRYSDAERLALQARADRTSAGLARLPTAPGTTYRGTDLTDEQLALYEPGRMVTERAFTSTSRDVRVAQEDFDGNTFLTVTGQNGRDVTAVSQLPYEAEIVYDKGTPFLVTGRTWDPDLGKWLITLEEVLT